MNSASFYIQLNKAELGLFGLWFNVIRLFKVGGEQILLGGELVGAKLPGGEMTGNHQTYSFLENSKYSRTSGYNHLS